jgi:hypothetical protein
VTLPLVNSSELQDVRLQQAQNAQSAAQHFVQLAMRGLPQMLDERAGMFCYKLKKTGASTTPEGLSPRYTAMTVMGLHRLEQSGVSPTIDVKPIVERLLTKTEWIDNIGDLGVSLWLAARVAPDRTTDLARRLQIETALTRFEDARKGVTMNLAWFLTGLSYCSQLPGDRDQLRALAQETYALLTQNQGKQGYFGHLATRRSLDGSVRGHIGSFADQVYPIYAMAQYFGAFGDESALQRARECAHSICAAQGPLGQWWWHYDSRNGRVFEEYPVFSVHQHGMGPMTLLALGKVTGQDFNPWIYKGLQWINRRNELSVEMEDASVNVIWRCIRQSALKRVSGIVLRGRKAGQAQAPNGLSVLHECRPYELGWLLYGLTDLFQN